jgi:Flp pilus assembly protein TadB
MMLLAMLLGAMFGAGVWLIAAAIWPPRPSLAAALERLHTPGEPRHLLVPSTPSTRSLTVRTGRRVMRRVRGGVLGDSRTMADLAIVARPLEVYAGTCALVAIAGFFAGPLLWALVAVAGTRLPVLVPLWIGLLAAVAGWLTPRVVLQAHAASARRDFRHALAAYLDVLVLLLAAGEGPEGAMDDAARRGNGRAFIELRRAIREARLSGVPVWDTLDALGRRLDVSELREIAAAGSLAGEQGAAVRKTLMAKARSMRAASLAEAEAQARRRSQSMFLPIVLMGLGFIVFLLYPLITSIQLG